MSDYLSKIYISFNSDLPVELQSADPVSYSSLQEKVRELTHFSFRPRALYDYIEEALKKERTRNGGLGAVGLTIHLKTEILQEDPYFVSGGGKTFLHVELQQDPIQLLAYPIENEVLGELFAGLIEQALEKLAGSTHFPIEAIQCALDQFRRNNYTYHFRLGERMLPGTKVKGRIDVALACDGLRRKLTISYRGKELSTHDLIGEYQIPVHFYRFFSRFHMDGNVLTVDRASPTGEDTHIDLADFPDVMKFVENTRTT